MRQKSIFGGLWEGFSKHLIGDIQIFLNRKFMGVFNLLHLFANNNLKWMLDHENLFKVTLEKFNEKPP